ncbi:unnamed protein product [Phaeothamnion confervicola]
MRAAEQLYDKLRDRLAAEMSKRLGFRLVLTGHSLGAGVAVLMTGLLARDHAALGLRCEVKCFAYAPPPVFALLGAFPTEASASATRIGSSRSRASRAAAAAAGEARAATVLVAAAMRPASAAEVAAGLQISRLHRAVVTAHQAAAAAVAASSRTTWIFQSPST